jgi:hypothetical protein
LLLFVAIICCIPHSSSSSFVECFAYFYYIIAVA